MTNFTIDPARTALINVDMQNCFVTDSPVAAPRGIHIIPNINAIADAVRSTGGHVVHTKHVVGDDGAGPGVMSEFSPAVRSGLLSKDNPTADLHPGIVVEAGDILLEKPRYGAFFATGLELLLRTRRVESVIITGIATNVCCETTAREAAMRDLRVYFINNATATFDLPSMSADTIQQAACATLALCFAKVQSTDDIVTDLINQGRRSVRSSGLP